MTIFSDNIPWTNENPAHNSRSAAQPTDRLIRRCLSGDAVAYTQLYQTFSPIIYRLVYTLLQNREDAEEVLQDAFEYAFRRLDQFDPQKSAFKTWLYRIAISRSRNKRRRKWLPTFSLNQFSNSSDHESEEVDIADQSAIAPDVLLELSGRQELVWEALSGLSDKLRETAVLRYYEGLTYQEIGLILDIPPKTAESRMRLAHKTLRKLLAEKI